MIKKAVTEGREANAPQASISHGKAKDETGLRHHRIRKAETATRHVHILACKVQLAIPVHLRGTFLRSSGT